MTIAIYGLLLLACVAIAGCEVNISPSPPQCGGYLVTSACNQVDAETGFPTAGCHDDALKWKAGCTYKAGNSTVLCVLKCDGAVGMTPAVTSTGGVGGKSQPGTGGTFVPGPDSKMFTAADKALCEDWPICPDGVVSPAPSSFVVPTADGVCPNAPGGFVKCGWCVDTNNTCAAFIGRCRAPYRADTAGGTFAGVPPSYCAQFLADSKLAPGFVICTGDANAQTVCGP